MRSATTHASHARILRTLPTLRASLAKQAISASSTARIASAKLGILMSESLLAPPATIPVLLVLEYPTPNAWDATTAILGH